MKQLALPVIIVLVSFTGFAQQSESIRSDRPGQSSGPFTAGKHKLIGQLGADRVEINALGRRVLSTYSCDLRYGIAERWELGISGFNTGVIAKSGSASRDGEDYSSSTLDVRLRHNFREANQLVPAVGVQYAYSGVELSTHDASLSHSLTVMTYQEYKFVNLTLNGSVVLTSDEGDLSFNGAATIGFQLSNRLSVFGEYYGASEDIAHYGRWDGGIAFLATKNVQFDCFAGYTEVTQSESFRSAGVTYRDFFVSLGISLRIPVTRVNR